MKKQLDSLQNQPTKSQKSWRLPSKITYHSPFFAKVTYRRSEWSGFSTFLGRAKIWNHKL